MEWKQDSSGLYVVTVGDYQGVILRSTGTIWKARVIHNGNELLNDAFSSFEDALSWCVTQLAEVRVRS